MVISIARFQRVELHYDVFKILDERQQDQLMVIVSGDSLQEDVHCTASANNTKNGTNAVPHIKLCIGYLPDG